MTDTVFIPKTTVIKSTWLNDVNALAYKVTSDVFTGTGAQVAFVLAATPLHTAPIQAIINGVVQRRNSYTHSAKTITFSEAPPLTSTIEVISYVAP